MFLSSNFKKLEYENINLKNIYKRKKNWINNNMKIIIIKKIITKMDEMKTNTNYFFLILYYSYVLISCLFNFTLK